MSGITQILLSVCLGVALSACCGFRIFIPLLGASVAGFCNLVILPPDMQWMASLPAIICFGTAAIIEVVAYYIPFLDNLLDFAAAPLSVLAGTMMASSFISFPPDQDLLRWVVSMLAGGTAAGTIQLGSGLLRIFSTKATVGIGNGVIASLENVAAIAGTVLAFVVPVVVAFVLIILVIFLIIRAIKKIVRKENRVF